MAAHSYSDTAVETALSAGVSAAATEIQVGSVSGFPVTYPYYLDIDFGSVTLEVVEVTSGAGTTLTVTRGASTTSAIGHSSGAVVRHVAPADHYTDVEAHVDASAAVHGLTGDVVGTTDAQTLTDKTMSGDDNTFSDIPQAAVTGLVTGLAAVDTLIDNHIADATAAHAASAISFSPSGTIVATTVQAAIAELDAETDARLDALEDDTGWVSVTTNSGFGVQTTPQVRRIGNMVFARGGWDNTGMATNSTYSVGLVPSGFIPPASSPMRFATSTGATVATGFVVAGTGSVEIRTGPALSAYYLFPSPVWLTD